MGVYLEVSKSKHIEVELSEFSLCYSFLDDCDIHPLWQEIVCEDGSKIYLNPYTGK